MGAQVEERIVAWKEGESMRIDIYEGKNMPMITSMEAAFSLTPDGDTTILTGTFKYGMTNLLGYLMNKLTMKKMNEKAWVSFMIGIKQYVETGVNIEKDTKLDIISVKE